MFVVYLPSFIICNGPWGWFFEIDIHFWQWFSVFTGRKGAASVQHRTKADWALNTKHVHQALGTATKH